MVSIPRSSDKNRCNRLFRLSLLSSVTTRHTTSFRFHLRKYFNTIQSLLQPSSSFSYSSAQTLNLSHGLEGQTVFCPRPADVT